MAPRPASIEVATIAHVLDALTARTADGVAPIEEMPIDAVAIDDMLARAVAELGQHPRARAGSIGASTSAPVLGSGVLQRLIAARRHGAHGDEAQGMRAPSDARLDQRL